MLGQPTLAQRWQPFPRALASAGARFIRSSRQD